MANHNAQDRVQLQSAPEYIEGSPEGLRFAPAGWFIIDWTTGDWYRKTTNQDMATGWNKVTSGGAGGGNLIGVGPPPAGLFPDGTIYTDRTTSSQWYFDILEGGWVQYSV